MTAANTEHITSSGTRAGRAWLACLGVMLAIAGIVFTVVLWRSYQRAMETRAWIETPCRVSSSVIISEHPTPHSPTSHRLALKYEYNFGGASHTGTRIKRVDGPTPHRDKIDALAASYPQGRTTTCFVNPAAPDLAVLRHDSKAALYSTWFPLIFVIGGGMITQRAIFGRDQ